MDRERTERLATFVATVEDALDWEFDPDSFEDRVRLQKYVHLSDAFGFDHEYDYNMYLHGPYSPDLAEDYYDESFTDLVDSAESGRVDFDVGTFARLADNRDQMWLEVAATIKSLFHRYRRTEPDPIRPAVIDKTTDLKDVSESDAELIYDVLSSHDVLQ